MSMSVETMKKELEKNQKIVRGGKASRKALNIAKMRVGFFTYRLKQKPAKAKAVKAPKAKKHVVSKEQGILPGFLTQMNMVRIEELVADKLFKQLQGQLPSLKETTKNIKKAVKAKSARVHKIKKSA